MRAVVTRRFLQGPGVCAALKATHMVIHSPFITWGYNHRGLYAGDAEQRVANVRETLAPVLARASDMGVTLMLENIEDIDPTDRAQLCEALDWQALALSVDTGHAHYAHTSTGAPPVDFFIRAAGARLDHVHLQDSDGYADRHWQLGQGTILWHSVFDALRKTGATPPPDHRIARQGGGDPFGPASSRLGVGRITPLKFVILSDLHLGATDGAPVNGLDTGARLAEAVRVINRDHADAAFVIVAGDLADQGEVAAYQRLKSLLADLTLPVHLTLGNHDDRAAFLSVFGADLDDAQGRVSLVIDQGGHRIILLDTSEDQAHR